MSGYSTPWWEVSTCHPSSLQRPVVVRLVSELRHPEHCWKTRSRLLLPTQRVVRESFCDYHHIGRTSCCSGCCVHGEEDLPFIPFPTVVIHFVQKVCDGVPEDQGGEQRMAGGMCDSSFPARLDGSTIPGLRNRYRSAECEVESGYAIHRQG